MRKREKVEVEIQNPSSPFPFLSRNQNTRLKDKWENEKKVEVEIQNPSSPFPFDLLAKKLVKEE